MGAVERSGLVLELSDIAPPADVGREVGGRLGAIETREPRVRLRVVMPCLAKQADRLALLRSFVPATDDHFHAQAFGLSGRRVPADRITAEPNLGAVVAKVY